MILVNHNNNQRQVMKTTYKNLFGKVRWQSVTAVL